ncbi:uncharacterized protein LOC108104038 [Drosophila eugracilis]|uniref:uncharacterized protein LOC108104038 n=1 Tax=Drosophila eugracilis TaxID=29029 RepID=UPI001BD921EA|nr:uncharacterized protein LOC108104038 [Drosophila eugracilis]
MFPDDYDVEPFNPFNVGPPNSGTPSEFKIPTCVTYPPPVFVAKPEYLQETASKAVTKSSSKIGEVAVSKAINEEMAVAKKQAAAIHEKDRFDAGAISKVKLTEDSQSKETVAKESLRTLLPVRSSRQASGEGKANSKVSASKSSVTTKKSFTSKQSQSSIASKSSNVSQARSAVTNKTSSNTSNNTLTPKSILKSPKSSELAKVSYTTVKPQVSDKPSETGTQRTVNSKAGVSASEPSLKPQKSKVISQQSVKAKPSDAVIKDSKEQPPSNPIPKKSQETASNDVIKLRTNMSKVLPESKDGPSYIQSESALSYRQSLNQQAAELADRLNAGNENFRRYNSVARNHSTTVPQKLSQGDRMTFWFSDAVLS